MWPRHDILVRPPSFPSTTVARTALPQHRLPCTPSHWAASPPDLLQWWGVAPGRQCIALHGMGLQTNWDSAQHAAATTALADHLSGIVFSTGRLGTWPDRLMAAPRLPWELPTPSLSWSRPGQLLSRARGCVTRSQTGGWRTRCGRSALLPLPFRRRRRRDELFSLARCGAPALLPLQLSLAGLLGRRRRRRDVLCSPARGGSAPSSSLG